MSKYFFLNFKDTKIAFSYKSNLEIKKSFYLFRLLSMGSLSKIGRKLLRLMIYLNLPVNYFIKKTIYQQFCAGTDFSETKKTAIKLNKYNLSSVLDYSTEAHNNEEEFEQSFEQCLKVMEESKILDISDFIVFKPTSMGSIKLFEKISINGYVSSEDTNEWNKIKERFKLIFDAARVKQMKVLVDAEESWIQKAIDDLVFENMLIYNRDYTLIYNTIQAYRNDRLDYLKQIHQKFNGSNVKIGVKLVRGAYMQKENKRAKELNYKSPICKNKFLTDKSFNDSLKYIFKNINDFCLFIGTHNEKSNLLAVKLMQREKIENSSDKVWFSQLYGMSDNISFLLAKKGYNVAKLIPFGPVKEVIPYLMRRIEENTSISEQTNRELSLIRKEIERRKKVNLN